MSSNEDLNNTDPVLSTGTPQDSSSINNAQLGTDIQSAPNPQNISTDDTVEVQSTGQPIEASPVIVDTSSSAPLVMGSIVLVIAVAIVVFIMRVRGFSSSTSSASLLKSESDVPRKSASNVSSSAKSTKTSKSTKTAKKSTAKKVVKKKSAVRKKRR